MPLLCRFAIPMHSKNIVLLDTASKIIAVSEAFLCLSVVLIRCLLIPITGLTWVFDHTYAILETKAKLPLCFGTSLFCCSQIALRRTRFIFWNIRALEQTVSQQQLCRNISLCCRQIQPSDGFLRGCIHAFSVPIALCYLILRVSISLLCFYKQFCKLRRMLFLYVIYSFINMRKLPQFL